MILFNNNQRNKFVVCCICTTTWMYLFSINFSKNFSPVEFLWKIYQSSSNISSLGYNLFIQLQTCIINVTRTKPNSALHMYTTLIFLFLFTLNWKIRQKKDVACCSSWWWTCRCWDVCSIDQVEIKMKNNHCKVNMYNCFRSGHRVSLFEKGSELFANVRSWGFVTLFSPNNINMSHSGREVLEEMKVCVKRNS